MKKIIVLCLSMLLWTAVAFAGVNINTASVAELNSLPHIGHTKAQAIIDYRNEHGAFKTKEQVTDVKGIGSKTFEKIKDQIDL
jgi:competence protein ComEA